MAELFDKNREVEEMSIQKDKQSLESSSRIANLNQILLQTKQACSQLESRNEELQEQEKMLITEFETLEKKCTALSIRLEAPCPMCVERESSVRNSKDDISLQKSYSTPAIPITTIPELTEIDRLKKENKKVNQKYECLLANFQMVSDKSSQQKQELKENEKTVVDLQNHCDSLMAEKQIMATDCKKARFELQGSNDKNSTTKRKQDQLQEEAVCLIKDLEGIQGKYIILQEQHAEVLYKLKNMQDAATNLQSQVSSLKVNKAKNEQALSSAQYKIDDLINEVEKCKEESDVSTDSDKQTSIESQLYHEKLKRVEQEKEEIANDLVKVSSHFDTLQNQRTSIENTNKKLETRIQKLEHLVEKLEESKHTAAIEHEELVNLRSLLASLSDKNESLIEENKTLALQDGGSSSRVQNLKRSVTKYQRESQHSWEMAHKFQKDLEKIENDLISTQESLENKTHEYDKLINEMKQMKKEIQSSVSEKATLQEELGSLYTRIDHLETSNYELHSRCSEISNANNTSHLLQQQTEEKFEKLYTKLTATESVLYEKEFELNKVKIAVDMTTQENSKLIAQLDKLSQSLIKSNEEVESLRSKLAHYEHETAVIAKGIEELERVHLDCQPTRARLQIEIDQFKESLRMKDKEIGLIKEELASSKVDLKQLQGYNESLESIVEDLDNKLQVQLLKNDNLSLEVEDKEKLAEQFKLQLDAKCSLIKDMESERKQAQNEFDRTKDALRQEAEKVEARYIQLQEENNVLFANHKSAASNVRSLEETIKELGMITEAATIEKDQIAKKMEALKEDKSYCQKQAETLQSQLKETKHELRYQKTKLREQEKFIDKHMSHYSSAVRQFKSLRTDALQILSDTSPTGSSQSSYRSRRRHLSDDSGDILRLQ